MSTELKGDFTAGPGGVWTEEVGVITGALTLRSILSDDLALTLHVQYQQADEWYVIKGGRTALKDAADMEPVHNLVLGILNRPNG